MNSSSFSLISFDHAAINTALESKHFDIGPHTTKFRKPNKMGGDRIKKDKRQKREDYRAAMRKEDISELPRKKFYRQRAHANPFSDHQLI